MNSPADEFSGSSQKANSGRTQATCGFRLEPEGCVKRSPLAFNDEALSTPRDRADRVGERRPGGELSRSSGRPAAVLRSGDRRHADRYRAALAIGRAGSTVGVKFGGRGLDARLFTDLSKLGPDRLIIPNAEAFVRTECPAAVAQHRGPCPICPTATSSGTWSLWEFRWQPEKPGKHSIFLRVPDEFIPQRRLDNGCYMREVSI